MRHANELMEAADQATPRPWRAGLCLRDAPLSTQVYGPARKNEHGWRIDCGSGVEGAADAALIVRCVNVHDDLVAAGIQLGKQLALQAATIHEQENLIDAHRALVEAAKAVVHSYFQGPDEAAELSAIRTLRAAIVAAEKGGAA